MSGHEQTKLALTKLEEVRDMIREAEVELRESEYYPAPEARHRLSEVTSSLAAAEQALRTVLEILETSGETTPEDPSRA